VKPNVFKMVTSEITYYFRADSEVDMLRWIAGLVQVVCRLEYEKQRRVEAPSHSSSPLTKTKIEVKEGELSVLGSFRQWKRRWVVLKGGVLFLRELSSDVNNKSSGQLKEKFALYKCKLEEYNPESEDTPCCFQLIPSKEQLQQQLTSSALVLQASTLEEMHMWLNAILKQKLLIEETIDSICIK